LHPAGNEHPAVHGRADDGVALQQGANLVVGQLALMRHQGAAVVMAGPNRPGKILQRLPKTFVAQMRDIEDHAQTLHFRQQLASLRRQAAGGIGALRVTARTVVRQADGAQSLGISAFQMPGRDERIGPFQA
jgi:hypothetical protein